MVLVWGVVLTATRALASAGSIPWGSSSLASTLRGGGRRTRGLNAELLCVLVPQSLPAGELHGVGADDASNRLTREVPRKDVEGDVPARCAPGDVAADRKSVG